jgi:hypothetical protein
MSISPDVSVALQRINRREQLYRWAEFCVLATQADIPKTHANFEQWRAVKRRLEPKQLTLTCNLNVEDNMSSVVDEMRWRLIEAFKGTRRPLGVIDCVS